MKGVEPIFRRPHQMAAAFRKCISASIVRSTVRYTFRRRPLVVPCTLLNDVFPAAFICRTPVRAHAAAVQLLFRGPGLSHVASRWGSGKRGGGHVNNGCGP